MPSKAPVPADRIIHRFIRSHRNDWSEMNRASATGALNRFHAYLAGEGADLLHGEPEELVEYVEDYLDHLATTPSEQTGKVLSGSSLQWHHRQLSAFYKWAAKDQGDGDRLIRRNPMLRVARPEAAPPDPEDMPVAETWQYEALLATCRGRRGRKRTDLDRRDAAILVLLWHTGMRRSELSAIDLDRVDFDREAIYLPKTKGGSRSPKSRWVPLVEEALDALDRWVDVRGTAEGPLFLSQRGTRLTADAIGGMLERRGEAAAKALGLDEPVHAPPHSFRRASAIAWLDAGGSETTLMTNHGWSTGAMIRVYTGKKRDELAAADAKRVAAARRGDRLRSVS